MKETNLPTSLPDYKTQTHQKNPQVTLPPTQTQSLSEEKAKPPEAFYRAVRLSICTPASVQGLTEQPRPQESQHTFPVLTPKLWDCRSCSDHPCANVTGQDLLPIISSHRSENPFAWLCLKPGHRLWLRGQQLLFQSTSLRPQLQYSTRHSISVTVLQLDWKL